MTKRRNDETAQGFSLVELLVVVTIIAIMSVSGIVGFRYMGDTMRTKEVAGVITDTVKKAELEILKNDYKKSTIHFLPDYLVVVSEPENTTLDLDYGSGCLATTETSQNLIKEDGEGNLLKAMTVSNPIASTVCAGFTDPNNEIEWRYQLRTGGEVSAVVRFIHFNLNRAEPSGITLSDTTKTLTIEAPYAKKTISDGSAEISLTVTSPENHTEDLIIK